MQALLVVLTDPASPEVDDEYNRWYTDEHLPDVLAVPGYVRATRYRAMDDAGPLEQQYLALYELEVSDLAALRAVSDEHMRRIAAGEMRRSPAGVMRRESMRAMYYVPTGPRQVARHVAPDEHDVVPEAVFLPFTDPASPADDSEFNRWYDEVHLPEVLDVPGFAAASRWVSSGIAMLDTPWVVTQRHLAVYELSDGSVEAFDAAMTELRRRIREGDRMDISPALGADKVSQAFTRVSERVTA